MKVGKGKAMARCLRRGCTYIVGRDQGYVSLPAQLRRTAAYPRSVFRLDGRISNPDHMEIRGPGWRAGLARLGIVRTIAASWWIRSTIHRATAKASRKDGSDPVSPSDKPTKGKKTRSNKATDNSSSRGDTSEGRETEP